jgi:hypothetical protein
MIRLTADLGDDADAALHGELGEEEVVGEEALPEASELQQPAEQRGGLHVGEAAHDLARDAAALDGGGEVGGQALELPADLREHEQGLPAVAVGGAAVVLSLAIPSFAAIPTAAAAAVGTVVG